MGVVVGDGDGGELNDAVLRAPENPSESSATEAGVAGRESDNTAAKCLHDEQWLPFKRGYTFKENFDGSDCSAAAEIAGGESREDNKAGTFRHDDEQWLPYRRAYTFKEIFEGADCSAAAAEIPGGESGDINNAGKFVHVEQWLPFAKGYSFKELLEEAEAGKLPLANGNNDSTVNLNSTPENKFGGNTQLAPVTPDKSTRSDNSNVGDSKPQDIEAIEKLDENKSLANVNNPGIDLNKTPPQQKQRRRKHRPKVVKEGKPKTPKPETPAVAKETPTRKRKYVRKSSNPTIKASETPENSTGKRKYVRKNKNTKGSETPAEVTGQCNNSEKQSPKKKSCRRELNFDEMDTEDEYTGGNSFNFNSEPLGHPLGTRSVSKVTVQLCQGIEQVTVRNAQAETMAVDGSALGVLDGITQTSSTCPTDSNSSTTVNMHKGNYCYTIQRANFDSSNSVESYRLISWQNNKKKRSEKGSNNMPSSGAFCDATENYFAGKTTPKDGSGVSEAFGEAHNNSCIIIDLTCTRDRPTKKRSRSATKARDSASLTRIAEQAVFNSCPTLQPGSQIDALIAQTRATLARKKRTKKRNLAGVQYSALQLAQPFSGLLLQEASLSTRIPVSITVNDIEEQFKCLDINRESNRIASPPISGIVPFLTGNKEHNELVLYNGGGVVVPFAPIRKPRPRPKVDLDDETTRVWKLLLENINSEGIDGTDEEKVKWWEEERKIFRGRADSFIARMHLVQGDRRFSKWKGSVLDSVVGVYLTQNVSDHLSSSAFMYLASHYPLKPKDCEVSEATPNQPICCNSDNEITGPDKEIAFGSEAAECCTEQEEKVVVSLLSLKHCVDSSTVRTNDKTGSCSESNSDGDCVLLETYNERVEISSDMESKDAFIESRITKNDKAGPGSSKESSFDHSYEIVNMDPGSLEDSVDPSSSRYLYQVVNVEVSMVESVGISREETPSSDILQNKTENSASDQSTITVEFTTQNTIQTKLTVSCPRELFKNTEEDKNSLIESQSSVVENLESFEAVVQEKPSRIEQNQVALNEIVTSEEECGPSLSKENSQIDAATSKPKIVRVKKEKIDDRDWDQLRKQAEANGRRQRTENTMDSLDWEAIRCADVDEVAETIKERGMNNKLARRIKDFLDRLVKDHGDLNLEWLRDVPPDQAKEYLLSFTGLGLKSVECVRLLTLHHLAFPVDTNVGRIAVRLGWVPLQPLPESLQLHLLELYPVLETIQKYLWPRLCKLDQRTLYELHYQMITFGKVFCTKHKPNCNACPMRGECKHFASAFASARLALPGPEEKSMVIKTENGKEDISPKGETERITLPLPPATEQPKEEQHLVVCKEESEAIAGPSCGPRCCEPIIEEPATPEPECIIGDIEDFPLEDPDEIPIIKLNIEEFTQNVQNYIENNMELQDGEMSKALVAISPEAASIPMAKLKNVNRLRTEHQVYELPDTHPLLERLQMEKREPDDPSPYLLAIWTPGETPNSITPPETSCSSQTLGKLCNDEKCFSCNNIRETNSQTVRGTLLIPCRTAMRGSFPLNGTYFQVNEVFADHDSSLCPIDVPRAWLWKLHRRTVYFGTSIPTIFRGLTTQGIQHCFWRGYVCVRGFDQKSRAPRPLIARLHFPASKGKRTRDRKSEE